MDLRSTVDGLAELQAETLGDAAVCIAVLDGPVDLSHPCFDGADVRRIDSLVQEQAGDGDMSLHGTHVTSLIFGQPGSPVEGVAPRCRGLVVPVFTDEERRLSQIDLARAIERAVAEGANVISVSGGQRSETGEADVLLDNALRLCEANNVLVVAAVGNDGADCVHVPAGLAPVLAVGATDGAGAPLPSNNWGEPYLANGLLTIGRNVTGAAPGGGTAELSGSSLATPVVAGCAALLADLRRRETGVVDPHAVRDALLAAASGGGGPDAPDCRRDLAGHLDITATRQLMNEGAAMTTSEAVTAAAAPEPAAAAAPPSASDQHVVAACSCSAPAPAPAQVQPQSEASASPVFVIGSIGHDFGTEANRDGFISQMPSEVRGNMVIPANPYDPRQLSAFLSEQPWFSDKLYWICKHENMPIYALEAEPAAGMAWGAAPTVNKDGKVTGFEQLHPPVSVVHKTFRDALLGQALVPDDPSYISRVSVPGRMTGRTVRLFSGQVLPVVTVQAGGLYTWSEAALIESLVTEIDAKRDATLGPAADPRSVRLILRAFLDKVYYQFRNLGQSGPDRALNYAATNAFSLVSELANGFLSGEIIPRQEGQASPLYALHDITVQKSQYTRHDSECYDVVITFFDPTNDRQAKVAYLTPVDVTAVLPVVLGPTRQFLISN